MPDGPLCAACHAEAVRHRGACARCGQVRLLPGADQASGERLCCRCAGIGEDYTCRRCGTEWALRHGLCEWCFLGDSLDLLMAGDVDLSALRARLLAVARPDRLTIWLYRPSVRELLVGLATGSVLLTHASLDAFDSRPVAEHVRGLLVAVGLLPARDERLARFDRWVLEHLAEHADSPEDLKVLGLFATWGLRRHLVTSSEAAPLRDSQVHTATQYLRVSAAMLAWLHDERGRELAACTQADLDCWFASGPSTHALARSFVRWAIATRRCPALRVPRRVHGTAAVLDQTARLGHLRRLLDPATGHLSHRVAGVLVVLFGQPFSRIAALELDDVVIDGGSARIRLGEGLTPIPPPFSAMFAELVAHRPNLNTATNPTSRWLFPGRSVDSHLTPGTLRSRVMAMGVNLVGARSGALRQLVLDCPPPVVADMLGYAYTTIDRHALRAGSPWASYAALRAHQSGGSPPHLSDPTHAR